MNKEKLKKLWDEDNKEFNSKYSDKHQAQMGCLIILLLIGIVVTSILQFFGGHIIFPILFIGGLMAVFVYYARSRKI